jgi:hypothetical protein
MKYTVKAKSLEKVLTNMDPDEVVKVTRVDDGVFEVSYSKKSDIRDGTLAVVWYRPGEPIWASMVRTPLEGGAVIWALRNLMREAGLGGDVDLLIRIDDGWCIWESAQGYSAAEWYYLGVPYGS